jgi:DNA polymerase-3 subunit delta'
MNEVSDFKTFSRIIGQEKAIQYLKRVMAEGKLAHAYLFVGIRGTGKTATAIALTQALNCLESVNQEACGRCPVCRQIMGGNFPDIVFVQPEGQATKIGQIRDLNRMLSFKPLSGRWRVIIIQQARTMTEEAANAFLKILEEPPEGNILILNVTEPRDLMPTIVSRCQKVFFKPIPERAIAEWLTHHGAMDERQALVIARHSGGSLGMALEMCESDFLWEREDTIGKLIRLSEFSAGQALNLAVEYSKKYKEQATKGPQSGDPEVCHLLGIWKSWYRDLIVMKIVKEPHILINTDFSDRLNKISKNSNMDHLIESFFALEGAQRDVLRNRNLDLVLENTLLRLRELGIC